MIKFECKNEIKICYKNVKQISLLLKLIIINIFCRDKSNAFQSFNSQSLTDE